MSGRPRGLSPWYAVWLVVFAVDASLEGRGRDHQLGAIALGLLFAALLVTELRSSRQQD